MPNVTVYTLPSCSQCDMTKRMLERNKIEYSTIDLSTNQDAVDMVKNLGYSSAPVVMVGRDKVIAESFVPLPETSPVKLKLTLLRYVLTSIDPSALRNPVPPSLSIKPFAVTIPLLFVEIPVLVEKFPFTVKSPVMVTLPSVVKLPVIVKFQFPVSVAILLPPAYHLKLSTLAPTLLHSASFAIPIAKSAVVEHKNGYKRSFVPTDQVVIVGGDAPLLLKSILLPFPPFN